MLKTSIFIFILLLNYFCLWFLFSFLGVNGVQPIGFEDSFGYVLPPKWLILLAVFISLVEYVVLTTLAPLGPKTKFEHNISKIKN